MSRQIEFTLSVSGITALQEELKSLQSQIKTEINRKFISLSLDWIKERAISYLNASGYDGEIVAEIAGSFVKTVVGNVGTLLVNHEKGAYLEFGVGVIAKGSAHNLANQVGWQYDVDSPRKTASRGWAFLKDSGKPLDMRRDDVIISKDEKVYFTHGGTGASFLYQAEMDFKGVAEQIYMQAAKSVLGG